MKICGVDIKGSEVRFVILYGTKKSFEVQDIKPSKIALENDEDNAEVKRFQAELFSFFRKYLPDTIVIKKRKKRGKCQVEQLALR